MLGASGSTQAGATGSEVGPRLPAPTAELPALTSRFQAHLPQLAGCCPPGAPFLSQAVCRRQAWGMAADG